jgi:hypothetical protein
VSDIQLNPFLEKLAALIESEDAASFAPELVGIGIGFLLRAGCSRDEILAEVHATLDHPLARSLVVPRGES